MELVVDYAHHGGLQDELGIVDGHLINDFTESEVVKLVILLALLLK